MPGYIKNAEYRWIIERNDTKSMIAGFKGTAEKAYKVLNDIKKRYPDTDVDMLCNGKLVTK